MLSRFLFKACGVPNGRINKTPVSELLFEVLLKRRTVVRHLPERRQTWR